MKKLIALLAAVAVYAAMAVPAFAAPGEPKVANGQPNANGNAYNDGTSTAYNHTPRNQPCATHC